MPRNALSFSILRLSPAAPVSPAWRTALVRLAVVWCALIAVFLPDWRGMADQWWNSSTYNHILLIPVIVAWLVWQRLQGLMRLEPAAWWPGLLLVAGAALIWLVGAFSGLSAARQLGAAALLVGSTAAILGIRASTALVFPLGYMLFLVPFGDVLVPSLQMITARIAIWLVGLSGIPATIDGVFINTPVALFEVAEACSGVRFLVAMIAFGVLVANVCFVGWPRRAVFLAVCIVVPILANGVRAWATIFAAQFIGVEVATGLDHIIYGWLFFALVLALILWISWRFFDRPVGDVFVDADRINESPLLTGLADMRIGMAPLVAGIALIVAGSQAWAYAADRLEAEMPRQIYLPQVPGWHRIDYAPAVWWEPRASGADHRLLGRYADKDGREVDVFFALYASQREGDEAGGFGQGALMPESQWSWQSPGPSMGTAKSDRLYAAGDIERLALTWYRTADLLTGSNARLKAAILQDKLVLRARPKMVLILSAEEREGKPAEDAIAAFRKAIGSTGHWMDGVAGIPGQ